jgi:plasmid maintenance system antidote protein VapI
MKVSRKFLIRVKLNEQPAYRIAQQAKIHPNTLSKLVHGAERIKPQDARVLAVGRVLGLSPEDCFETEAQGVVS